MNYTFEQELERILGIIAFKGYKRVGNVLYANYGYLKPECTISEVVWGWCYNPCFAKGLILEIERQLSDYARVLGRANREITSDLLYDVFDGAMARVCAVNGPPIAYSVQATDPHNCAFEREDDGSIARVLNGSEIDGQLWHGIVVPDMDWVDGVASITVTVHSVKGDDVFWQHTFKQSSVRRRIKLHDDDIYVFQPFRHPLPLVGLGIEVYTEIEFNDEVDNIDADQLFGVVSNDFWEWLTKAAFTIKLCRNAVAHIDMADRKMLIKQTAA